MLMIEGAANVPSPMIVVENWFTDLRKLGR
jgi:hypothetical protein